MQTDSGLRGFSAPSPEPSCSKQVSGTLPQILPRGSGQLGSYNVCRRGEPSAGDSRSRADDQARVLQQIWRGEELNHERPARAWR